MSNKRTIIGKTAPVPLGQQKAVNSLPVVFAEDQPAIPVEEQNKIQSEVALSLLGIPRAEVALGIFADVNTYDINPSEWSQFPIENIVNDSGNVETGLNHLALEAGAELVAATGKTTILTSKRFFRYQPGRVSSSTMGVKMNRTDDPEVLAEDSSKVARANTMKGAPSIKKWGIFDKLDGYYFEIANGGQENDFRCVRRTQALSYSEPAGVDATSDAWNAVDSGATTGSNIKSGNWGEFGEDPVIYRNGLCYIAAAIHDPSLVYNPADVDQIQNNNGDLNDFEFDERFALRLGYRDGASAVVEHMANRHYQFPFDQLKIDKASTDYQSWLTSEESGQSRFLKPVGTSNGTDYIRLDAHCKWQDTITNLTRGDYEGGGTATSNFKEELIVNGSNRVAFSGGTAINSTNHGRFGFDPTPGHERSAGKVWNLLVTTQSGTMPTVDNYNNILGASTRDSGFAYNPASTGSANKGVYNMTLKEWFHLCVPPEYRKVYEWRPVRAMFSGDQLNGQNNDTRWSDVSTANVDPTDISVKRPGDPVKLDGDIVKTKSEYDVDFSKVTMWKIEFSWYGAVGALFLCYVPVANGEARWVRVHHMRASNQLDVASLGNATLPITYLTHGGLESNLSQGNKLVKYGASYYIDGGDKGTVKLLSKSTDFPKPVVYGQHIATVTATSSNYIEFAFANSSTTRDQFIGAYLKSDTTRKVIWAESQNSGADVRLYFNASVDVNIGDVIELVVPRKQRAQMALRAKDNVVNTTGTPVRNRIQLYPLKYGVGLTDNSTGYENVVSLNFIKNPLLITNNLNNSTLPNTGILDVQVYTDSTSSTTQAKGLELGSGTVPVKIETANTNNLASFQSSSLLDSNGKYFYAYARGKATSDTSSGFDSVPAVNEIPVLVRVYKDVTDGEIYIQNYESQSLGISIIGPLMFVNMYTYDSAGGLLRLGSAGVANSVGSFASNHNKYENQKKWDSAEVATWESIAALSGAKVSQDFKLSPVAGTGNNVFSIYANKGGETYDLSDYFAYNKEYISFPLTNEVDILGVYSYWESTSKSISSPADSPSNTVEIVNSLTWEEQ